MSKIARQKKNNVNQLMTNSPITGSGNNKRKWGGKSVEQKRNKKQKRLRDWEVSLSKCFNSIRKTKIKMFNIENKMPFNWYIQVFFFYCKNKVKLFSWDFVKSLLHLLLRCFLATPFSIKWLSSCNTLSLLVSYFFYLKFPLNI